MAIGDAASAAGASAIAIGSGASAPNDDTIAFAKGVGRQKGTRVVQQHSQSFVAQRVEAELTGTLTGTGTRVLAPNANGSAGIQVPDGYIWACELLLCATRTSDGQAR